MTSPFVEEKAPFKTALKSWKEQELDPKTRMTVLARTNSSLPHLW
jgi:hypothetical protein